MKNITLILSLLFVGVTASANSNKVNSLPYNYGETFIFVEGGVEFAVYPNGEFDFYYNPRFINTSIVNISSPGMNISYNAGYNYDAYVQYDDYGAVIQIENVPVFYDYYGRLLQAGDVIINYNRRGRIVQVGGLQIRYNSFNRPVRYIGYINHYNTRYIPRPWHQYYVRPHANYQVVYSQPYRAYYEPVRIDYIQYNTYYQNNNYYYNKNDFYRPGQQVTVYNHGRRTSTQRAIEPVGRSLDNSTTRKSNAIANTRENSTPVRTRTSATRSSTATNIEAARTRSNVEQHEEAVRAQRTSSSVSNNAPGFTRSRNAVESRSIRSTTTNAPQTRTVERANATRSSTPSTTSSIGRRTSSQDRNINMSTRNESNNTTIRSQSTTSRSAPRASRETFNTRRISGGRG